LAGLRETDLTAGKDRHSISLIKYLEVFIMEATERTLHYSTEQAIQAQAMYCEIHKLPFFAPGYGTRGCCPHCHNPIFIIGGISVEEAGETLITGCPYCHYSFVE
jgi:hypothetical protein